MSEVEKRVGVAKAVKPKFLSLVGAPANQVAFKVIRDDNGEEIMSAPHIQRKRKARRSDQLIAIEFDAAASDESIGGTMAEWGVEAFTIETYDKDGDKKKIVRCADPGDAPTMQIRMDDGSAVTVLKPISSPTASEGKTQIAVVRMEFAPDYFPSLDDISSWCKRNGVDFSDIQPQTGGESTVVTRSVEVEADAEVHRIEVDSGVRFVVARSEEADVPENFVLVVNDMAYGSWGWGQLDFAAAMADIEFSEMVDESTYVLRRVISDILFYSELPVDARKQLIARATQQFSDFVAALMDALPARVVIANRSDPQKEYHMSKTTKPEGNDTARQDADATPDATTDASRDPSPAADEKQGATVSREDVQRMIDDALGGVTTKLEEISSKIGTPAPEGDDTQRADGDTASDAAEGATTEDVLRSINSLAEAVKGVNDRLEKVEGDTTMRSDADDGEQSTQRKDPFKGMFGGGKKD